MRAALAATVVLVAGAARAVPRLRGDLVLASSWPSVDVDRSADAFLHLDLEVELPLEGPFTLGARGTPVFLYRVGNGTVITGLGFGLTTRAYLRGAVHTGTFFGIAVSTLRTNGYFSGDSSRLNFLSQLSVGWQAAKEHWHLAATFEHISNAWTTSDNHGVNGMGASFGFDW